MGRRKLCGIAAAGGMFLLTGCSGIFGDGTAEPIQSMKIGICTYDQFDTFIGTLVEEFKEEARQKEQETGVTITVEVVGAGGKQNIQNDQVESLINNGCDILLVNQVDRTDTTMVIDKAKNADIPVIFFNRELVREDLERWEKLYYVGVKTLESGVMQGEIVVDLCSGEQGIAPYDKNGDGRLQYVMLEGEAGHQDALIRTEYAVNTITNAGIRLTKLDNEIANWSRAQAQTKMNQWLEEFGDRIELVLANNDDMALGAIDAWKESGKPYMAVVVGVDGTEAALDAMREGTLAGTVVNDTEGQARGMMELAYSLYFQTPLPDDIELEEDTYIRLPHTVVTAEMLQDLE